jgi:putative tryptophan/tyrosine transport system substrate-binding protein
LQNVTGFLDGMRARNEVEGQSFDITYRFADEDNARLTALVEDLVRLNADVIVASQTSAALAAKKATQSIPIVAALLDDPVRMGLIASYARPGGNLTGIAVNVEGLNTKQVELVSELVPGVAAVGLLVNPTNPTDLTQRQDIEAAGAAQGFKMTVAEASAKDDLDQAFRSLSDAGVQAVIVLRDAMMVGERRRVAALALAAHLPTVFGIHEHVEAGGLISYGVSVHANFRRAAYFVDTILRGAKPADLPVEFPTELEMSINLKTAKALGLAVPPSLLARADEVIE